MGKKKKSNLRQQLKSTLLFFNDKLTDLNDKRLQLNRGKGLAKYIAKSLRIVIKDTSSLDTTFGMMSFSLYLLRLSANIGLLMQLFLKHSSKKINHKKHRGLYYRLLNDSLWSTVNLTQFFWLSYANSNAAGLQGMRLDTVVQLIDSLVMIIRFQQDKEDYELSYTKATPAERARLEIEWQNKQLNFFRSILTGLSIALISGLMSFFEVAVPSSPIISVIVLISALVKILFNIERDRQLIHQLKLNKHDPQKIMAEEQAMRNAHLKDLNQVILNNIFIPLGLFLLITTPIPLAVTLCLCLLLIHYVITNLIDMNHSPNSFELPVAPQP